MEKNDEKSACSPPGIGDDLTETPSFSDGWNLSFAYHKLLQHNEIYLVYGDASAFSTSPQLIFKVVHYFGADKGT